MAHHLGPNPTLFQPNTWIASPENFFSPRTKQGRAAAGFDRRGSRGKTGRETGGGWIGTGTYPTPDLDRIRSGGHSHRRPGPSRAARPNLSPLLPDSRAHGQKPGAFLSSTSKLTVFIYISFSLYDILSENLSSTESFGLYDERKEILVMTGHSMVVLLTDSM